MIPRWAVNVLTTVLAVLSVANMLIGWSTVIGASCMALLGAIAAVSVAPSSSRPVVTRPGRGAHRPARARPDADLAQHLTDDDRAWLTGHGWRDPAADRIRITDNHADRARPAKVAAPDRARRAREIVSIIDDHEWRTITYADGRTEEYADVEPQFRSGRGHPTDPAPAGALYLDENTGIIYRNTDPAVHPNAR